MNHQKQKIDTSEQALISGDIPTFKKLFGQEVKKLDSEKLPSKLQALMYRACHGGMRLDTLDVEAITYLMTNHKDVLEKNVLTVGYKPDDTSKLMTPIQTACRYRNHMFIEKIVGLGMKLDEQCLVCAKDNWMYSHTHEYIKKQLELKK